MTTRGFLVFFMLPGADAPPADEVPGNVRKNLSTEKAGRPYAHRLNRGQGC
jgi:hypothetical protein